MRKTKGEIIMKPGKRVLTLLMALLCLVSVLSFSACGKKESSETEASQSSDIPEIPQEETWDPPHYREYTEVLDDNGDPFPDTELGTVYGNANGAHEVTRKQEIKNSYNTAKKSDVYFQDAKGKKIFLAKDSRAGAPYNVGHKIKLSAEGKPAADNFVQFQGLPSGWNGNGFLFLSGVTLYTGTSGVILYDGTYGTGASVNSGAMDQPFTLTLRDGITFGSTKQQVQKAYPGGLSNWDMRLDPSGWRSQVYQDSVDFGNLCGSPLWPTLTKSDIFRDILGKGSSLSYWYYYRYPGKGMPCALRLTFWFTPENKMAFYTLAPSDPNPAAD